ncbi:MAG: response regulator [Kiloniellales bacterium]|nr:response regulator [Kiloniellales bacterium]
MSYNLEPLKVLIVDDNKHMHQILRSILTAMRIKQIRTVDDAAEAFNEMRNWPPDLIITDLAMDLLDGLEFVRLVRNGNDSPNPYVPIIMLTGHTELFRVKEARDSGVNEILAKPVSIQGLYKRIIGIVASPRPFIRTTTYFGPCRRRAQRPFKGEDRRLNAMEPENADSAA